MSKNPGAGQSSGCRRKSRTSRFDRPRASFMSNPFKTRPADRRFVQLYDQFAADPPQKADSMAGHRPVAMGQNRTHAENARPLLSALALQRFVREPLELDHKWVTHLTLRHYQSCRILFRRNP